MIVMKFGGTSVEDATAIDRVAAIVRGRLSDRPSVVVSAMARVTDTLLAMAKAANEGRLEDSLQLAKTLRERHLQAAQTLLPSAEYEALVPKLDAQFAALQDLMRGIAAVGECSPRTTDNVLSFGELLSSVIVVEAFKARGMDALWVDPRKCLITNGEHTKAAPQFKEANPRLAEAFAPAEQGRVPVMGGFVGGTLDGTTTTIGRGGSDYSAAIVGAAIRAKRIEIWTDVEGIMTTDPRLCPAAQTIDTISFDEAAEMAYFGAKVLHPATVIPAVEKNIPVYVLNSRNPESKGTCIRGRAPQSRTLFRAIAAKKGISIVSVSAPRTFRAHDFLKSVFDVVNQHRVPVDIVSTSEVSVSLTVESSHDIPALVADLRQAGDVVFEGKKAIVCMVGADIEGKPGVAARVFSCVAEAGVNVRMISQGASEINISFVIEEEQLPVAIRHLHATFFENVTDAKRAKKATRGTAPTNAAGSQELRSAVAQD